MINIDFRRSEEKEVEMVERKGIGHPDSIADGISESVSRALSQKYMEELGFVAHHNTDEVQIIGGRSAPKIKGGKIVKPIYILLGGRATQKVGEKEINIHGTAIKAAKEYISENINNLDVETDVVIDSRIGEGSEDLTEMYGREEKVPLSNDTSFGVGHYPFTETEEIVYNIETFLNSKKTKEKMPWLGEDIKVMAYRRKEKVTVTVAAAFVDRFVESLQDYREKKEKTLELIKEKVFELTDKEVEVHINTADDEENGSVYLTVTGTSAEMGDDGSTGRGNRTNGVITPFNPMSLEATSGKNPVAHVGKIYNILSLHIAEKVVKDVESVESATVKILSQIGKRIDEPQLLNIEVETENGEKEEETEKEVSKICEEWLGKIPEVMEKVIQGEVTTF